ncbi:MAG TPA: cation diffusion facilitator family transporter [Nitrososphaeraceae archaeon]|nr:cation diffusion facilitator family transporter [Nitrososphaeraceae archaeon]
MDTNSQSTVGSLTATKKILQISTQLKQSNKPRFIDKSQQHRNIVNEGLIAGQKIAKISIITLLGIGITELVVGYWGGSIVAIADGIDSFSDAMISFIVLLGLRIAHRPPNKKFQYGYHKVESFAALMAAIGMIIIGSIIFYNSYQALVHPHEIKQPIITMIVLAAAGIISLHRAFQMRNIANKYNLLSLKTDAKNSIKDGSASIIGFVSVVIATQFGFLQMDAIGGMIIAVYIFSVSYMSLKKSSFILVDSCEDSNLSDKLKKMIMERFNDEIINVKSILIRPTGMAMHAEVHVEIDGRKRFGDVDLLLIDIEMVIRSKFPNMASVTIIPHSSNTLHYHHQNEIQSSITTEIKN